MIFGIFQKADDRSADRFAIYIADSDVELLNSYDQNPLKNYKDEPRLYFINADDVYCWDYNFMYRLSEIDPGIIIFNIKKGSLNKQRLGQEHFPKIKTNIFISGNELYAYYYVRYAPASKGVIKRIEKIGGRQSTDITKMPFDSIAECSYDGKMYVLADDGTIYQIVDIYERTVYIDKDDIPKEYELSGITFSTGSLIKMLFLFGMMIIQNQLKE